MQFGPFTLLGEIAKGGMAEVHFAVRSAPATTGRAAPPSTLLALKRILPSFAADVSFRRFFEAEAELSLALRHRNIVHSYEAGLVDSAPYLAMEYVHGRAVNRILHQLALDGHRLPIPYAVHLAVETLAGLSHVHQARDASGRELNAVLCDISPSNILVGYDGRVRLIDFGIATSNVRLFDQIGLIKGKKTYMAPEQLRGLPLDARADIFAMGICLIEFLTAQPLFTGRTEFEVEEMVRTGNLPRLVDRNPELPAGLVAQVDRALAYEPADRFQTAEEFAQELAPFARMGKGGQVRDEDVQRILGRYLKPLIAHDDVRLTAALDQADLPHPGTDP